MVAIPTAIPRLGVEVRNLTADSGSTRDSSYSSERDSVLSISARMSSAIWRVVFRYTHCRGASRRLSEVTCPSTRGNERKILYHPRDRIITAGHRADEIYDNVADNSRRFLYGLSWLLFILHGERIACGQVFSHPVYREAPFL